MRTRFSPLLLIVSFMFGGTASAAGREIAGTVVDQSGRALPRAYVRAIDTSSKEIAGAFADESGKFQLTVSADDCTVSATLTGFMPATAASSISTGAFRPGTCAVVMITSALFACSAIRSRPRCKASGESSTA